MKWSHVLLHNRFVCIKKHYVLVEVLIHFIKVIMKILKNKTMAMIKVTLYYILGPSDGRVYINSTSKWHQNRGVSSIPTLE